MNKPARRKLNQVEKNFLVWGNLIDLGVEAMCQQFAKKSSIGIKKIPQPVKEALRIESEHHWEGLYKALSRVK